MIDAILKNNKILSSILLIAIIGDFAIPYLLAPFYKGYSHTKMVMSTLGNPNSPVHILYNIWLVLLGVLLLIASKLIYLKYSSVSKELSITTVLLIMCFAIGAGIVAGIFSVNESKSVVTIASKIHGAFSAIGFMLLLITPLLLAILSFKSKNILYGVCFISCFVISLAFFVLFVLSDKPEFQNTIIMNEGLWQRLTLLFMYIPIAMIALSELLCKK